MSGLHASNPHLRNGPSSHRFRSTIQLSIGWSWQKLPALAVIIAEVLTLQAYSPSKHHDYSVDLTTADISRSRLNKKKFVIKTEEQVFNLFCNNDVEAEVWDTILTYSSGRKFGDYYRLGKQIADGRHSKVFLAHARNDHKTKFVVKVNNRSAECNAAIDRSQFERDAHLQLLSDFDFMKESRATERKNDLEGRQHRERKLGLFLDKIITLRDSFGTPAEDFLVFEYQDGMPLSEAIAKYGPLNEREARIVMWDLLTALHFMHEQGVVHRDLRASNVLYWNRCGNARAKLFDFSEARRTPNHIQGEEPFRDNPGHGPYKAIEVLSGRYHGKPADIWSCGVLLYKMLSGTMPFQGETDRELCDNIKEHVLTSSLFDAPVWNTVSPEAILLIKQMLQPDPFLRASALGARSHAWLNDENSYRQSHIGKQLKSYADKRQHVPQRLQTPVTSNSSRTARTTSSHDVSVLPAAFEPFASETGVGCSEMRVEPQAKRKGFRESQQKLTAQGYERHMPRDSAPITMKDGNGELAASGKGPFLTDPSTGGHDSDKSESKTPLDGDNTSEASPNLEVTGKSRFASFATSFAQTLQLPEQYGKMKTAFVGKLTELQAAVRNVKKWNPSYIEDVTSTSEDEAQSSPSESDASSEDPQTVSLARTFPDRARNSFPSPSFGAHGLSHRCSHLCSLQPCTRSRLMDRSKKLLASCSVALRHQGVSITSKTSGPLRLNCKAPDRAICARQQQRLGSASEIVPITKCLDEEVFQWAKGTKMFSGLTLRRAPVDPLFFCEKPSSVTRHANPEEEEMELDSSSRLEHDASQGPLRDEMCGGTHFMKSVVAAAHVGLSDFSKHKPIVARLLLGSPTVQLQLGMILPYRQKFRKAALTLMVMSRIVSLKKGTCLTRRTARGQPLHALVCTLITDIRRKCHMRPLRARMPKLLPPDVFTDEVGWRKERVEPRPEITARPQLFWSRQYEVKKGIASKAWKFLKSRMSSAGASSGGSTGENHGNDERAEGITTGAQDNGDGTEGNTTESHGNENGTSDSHDSDNSGDGDDSADSADGHGRDDSGDSHDRAENRENIGTRLCSKLRSNLQQITMDDLDSYSWALHAM